MKVLSETISEEGLETGVVVMTDRLQVMISAWVELKQRNWERYPEICDFYFHQQGNIIVVVIVGCKH